jgi:hypothetical protein
MRLIQFLMLAAACLAFALNACRVDHYAAVAAVKRRGVDA